MRSVGSRRQNVGARADGIQMSPHLLNRFLAPCNLTQPETIVCFQARCKTGSIFSHPCSRLLPQPGDVPLESYIVLPSFDETGVVAQSGRIRKVQSVHRFVVNWKPVSNWYVG